EYLLAVTMNNILIFSKTINPDTLFTARIRTDELPAGTAFVTLYDEALNPVAERLVFLNQYKKMKVQIGVKPESARSGGETELTVNTTDFSGENVSSIVSISVFDSISGFYNGTPYPDIETSFLYDREFYKNLPHEIKCTGLGNIDSRSLDLLLMTYGWRKYKLKELVFEKKEPVRNDYDHLRLTNPGNEKNGRTSVTLLSPEGGNALTVELDKNHEALVPFDSLDPFARQIMIMPDEKISKNRNPVNIDFPSDVAYSEKAREIKADSIYEVYSSFSPAFEGILFNPDSAVMIEPVTIKGKLTEKKEYVSKDADAYKYTGAFTLYSKDFKFAQTFEDILYRLGAYYVNKKNKRVILRGEGLLPKPRNDISLPRTALFVLDDIPIFDRTYFPIAQLPASDIASVTVVRGPQGFARYGNDARYGMILVTTKTGNRINGIKNPEDFNEKEEPAYKPARIFRSEIEYYTPTKEQVELIPEYQFRPTLLWKSDVYLDGSGPVKFSYPNNPGSGKVIIFINGVSLTNLVGSGRISYTVR
ncbi:MAG TPA: Plug domain-containing protein, partial [Bacteroidales bacterium]|nr:Plug domain-containing protein [Bacteroidales bacterium]